MVNNLDEYVGNLKRKYECYLLWERMWKRRYRNESSIKVFVNVKKHLNTPIFVYLDSSEILLYAKEIRRQFWNQHNKRVWTRQVRLKWVRDNPDIYYRIENDPWSFVCRSCGKRVANQYDMSGIACNNCYDKF